MSIVRKEGTMRYRNMWCSLWQMCSSKCQYDFSRRSSGIKLLRSKLVTVILCWVPGYHLPLSKKGGSLKVWFLLFICSCIWTFKCNILLLCLAITIYYWLLLVTSLTLICWPILVCVSGYLCLLDYSSCFLQLRHISHIQEHAMDYIALQPSLLNSSVCQSC